MRIKAVDGLRTIAVLGVLWAHIWMFQGNPSFIVAGVDLARLLSFFGTGVDLFFVISGFCMYLMYTNKAATVTFSYYIDYLKKRWIRIAPVYYFAILVYALFATGFSFPSINMYEVVRQGLFIRNFFGDASYAPHFWSLSVEWQFYMVLPLILLSILYFSFNRAITGLVVTCLLVRVFLWANNTDPEHLSNYTLANRLIEFVTGIIAANIFVSKRGIRYLNTWYSLPVGFVIAFLGRMLMTGEMVVRTDLIGVFARVINLPMLATGYAIILVSALHYRSVITSMLESRLFTSIGKYSYSMYLWHWIVAQYLSDFMLQHLHVSPFLLLNITFFLAVLILYPISWLSYTWFESFYFNRQKRLKLAMANKG